MALPHLWPFKARIMLLNLWFLKENDERKKNHLIYDSTVMNSLKQLNVP